jgi:hypothetical protein
MAMRTNPDQDNFIINLDEDWQCRWWSKEFGVAPEILKKAIREVGPLARNVRCHLQAMQLTGNTEQAASMRRSPS